MSSEGNQNGKKSGGRFNRLSVKFVLIFTLILTGTAAAVALTVGICARVYIDRNVESAVTSTRNDIDSGIFEALKDVDFAYSRIISDDCRGQAQNFASAVTVGARQSAYETLIERAGVELMNVMDVGFLDESGYFSFNGLDSPRSDIFEQANNLDGLILAGYDSSCVIMAVATSRDFPMRGTFVFFIAETALSDIYAPLGGDYAYFFIVRKDGYVISHDDKNYVGKTIVFDEQFDLSKRGINRNIKMRGEKKIVSVSRLTQISNSYGNEYSLVEIMDYDFYYGAYVRLLIALSAIVGLSLLTGVVIAIVRAKNIARPLVSLNESVSAVMGKDLEHPNRRRDRVPQVAHEGDEIYQLEKNYDEMISQIFSLMGREKEEMESQRKLELDALQMQINPHFLYNTLDAIVWMARINKQTEIETLVVNLANFFRLSLHRGDRYVTVEEELEIVRYYFECERTRSPERATLVFRVDESIKKYKTLKLLLQPFVENALKYAFPSGGGQIIITAHSDGNYIIFEVVDNGIGFDVPPNLLDSIAATQEEETKKSNLSGYGIYNVNRRIRLEYGSDCGVIVRSKKGEGTSIIVQIEKRI